MRRWRRRQCRRRTCRRRARRRPRLAGEAARAGRHRRRPVMSCDSCSSHLSFSTEDFLTSTADTLSAQHMTREQRKQLHDSRSGPGRHRHRALFITHASSNTSRRLRRTEGYDRTAAMVRADYSARAELHIRSNAASRSLTQTHTQHTTRPKRKKRDAKQNCSAAQCTPPTPAPVMSALAAHRMALDA